MLFEKNEHNNTNGKNTSKNPNIMHSYFLYVTKKYKIKERVSLRVLEIETLVMNIILDSDRDFESYYGKRRKKVLNKIKEIKKEIDEVI